MANKELVLLLVCAVIGGLLYQGGRAILGLSPTWDTFFETLIVTGFILVSINIFGRRR